MGIGGRRIYPETLAGPFRGQPYAMVAGRGWLGLKPTFLLDAVAKSAPLVRLFEFG